MSSVRATVVVPVRNGATFLPPLLARLEAQQIEGGLEILAIDSGSTDASTAILEEAGAIVLSIPPESFDHGETRNRAAREARGSVVVFLSQDALPADEHFVRRLAEALEREPRLAGAFARQTPRPDADPLTRRDLSGWIAARPDPRVVFAPDRDAFDRLPARERFELSVFDNVASAVPRALLLEQPFLKTRFGEDLEWGQRMLRQGYGLAYVPEALVVHSHPRSARALYRRNYLGHRLLERLFGLRVVPDRRHLLRAIVGATLLDFRDLVRAGASLRAMLVAPAQSIAAAYGQYRGARDESRGRPYPEWTP